MPSNIEKDQKPLPLPSEGGVYRRLPSGELERIDAPAAKANVSPIKPKAVADSDKSNVVNLD